MLVLRAVGIGLSGLFCGFVVLLMVEVYYLLCCRRKAIANPRVNSIDHTSLFVNGAGGPDIVTVIDDHQPQSDQHPIVLVCGEDELPESDCHEELVSKLFPVEDMNYNVQINRLLGPPRSLFTIPEETKEDIDSEDGRCYNQYCGSNECVFTISSDEGSCSENEDAHRTPFFTPLQSPSFFPSPSPLVSFFFPSTLELSPPNQSTTSSCSTSPKCSPPFSPHSDNSSLRHVLKLSSLRS